MANNLDFMKEKCYPCRMCDLVFYEQENLMKHTLSHSGEKKKSCVYCKKTIERTQNLKYHQQTCDSNIDRKKHDLQHGGGGYVADNGFKLVHTALGNVFTLYRKPLNTKNFNDVKLTFTEDLQNLLRREVADRKGIKWHLAMKAILYKLTDPSIVTDPPAVFNTDAIWGLIGSDYEEELNSAFANVIEQLDTYEMNGSGWVLDEFTELDVTILTCTPWRRRVDMDTDYDAE